MSVRELPDNRPSIELLGDRLRVREWDVFGPIVEVASEHVASSNGAGRLEEILRTAVDIGGSALLLGQSRATVESVAGQVDRLIATTTDATQQLPDTLQHELSRVLEALAEVLRGHFDPEKANSVQQQIGKIVAGASAAEARRIMSELLDENGPLSLMNGKVVEELKLFASSGQDVLANLVELKEKIEANLHLNEARERSTQKGRPFQEVVQAELDVIHGPLGDTVRFVGDEYGAVPNSKVGDFVVTLNPRDTRGKEVRLVLEAKTGKLTGPKAQAELDAALENRDAKSAILVFDGVQDAPLRGRRYCPYGAGKFIAVLDESDTESLALEVACRQARSLGIAADESGPVLDSAWVQEQCDSLNALLQEAREFKTGSNAARRGLGKIDDAYESLRAMIRDLLETFESKMKPEE